MLRELTIRDLLIIDRLELQFQAGLNVLTGETGAGKSILLDALGFVLGWRGRADLVRQGSDEAEVTAVFDLPAQHPARAVLTEAGLDSEDELILRRVNRRDGRKTAWVNDRRASGDVLRALSETLVELHGQHDDRGLLNPRGHMAILDAFGGLEGKRETVRMTWASLRKARSALDEAREAAARGREEEGFLRHAAEELDLLDPQPGEDATLDARRRLMQGAERIREDVLRANAVLGAEGAEGRLNDGLRWLEGAAEKAEGTLDDPIAAIARALVEVDEAIGGVSVALDRLEFDPGDLEACEERLFAIRALARKHGVAPDDLGGFAQTIRQRLAAVDAGEGQIETLEQALKQTETAYDEVAGKLTAARQQAAGSLDRDVMAELAPLKMDRAVFETAISEDQAGPEGRDAVTFRVATNPGAPAGPLNKIASGGELSRFLLALKVCLASGQPGLTMIFDEIDRGVGGATADAVGRRLAQIAAGGQVLVVTHSPQVAALGAHHWRVEKGVSDDTTISRVLALSEEERIDEIARMLAGDRVTVEARDAARALLKS